MAQKKTPLGLPADGEMTLPSPDGTKEVKYPFLQPTPEQLAIFAAEATNGTMFGRMAAALNFVEDIMANPNDNEVIKQRLRDRNDVLDFAAVFGQVREIMEEYSGFPTRAPSGSGNSPSTTGRRSTGKVQPGA